MIRWGLNSGKFHMPLRNVVNILDYGFESFNKLLFEEEIEKLMWLFD